MLGVSPQFGSQVFSVIDFFYVGLPKNVTKTDMNVFKFHRCELSRYINKISGLVELDHLSFVATSKHLLRRYIFSLDSFKKISPTDHSDDIDVMRS